MMVSRWVTLFSNVALESACGTSYAYAVYSDQLKNTTGFSQKDINQIASIGNIGLYFAIVAGIVFDKKGPWITLVIGLLLSSGGYALMGAAAGDYGVPNDVAWFSVYAFLWSNGSSWYDTVAMATNVRNFPNDRGRIVGLLKSFFGLSASIVTLVYGSYFKGDGAGFLFFLAGFCGFVGFCGTFTTSLVPPSEATAMTPKEVYVINAAMLMLSLLAAYLLLIAILEDVFDYDESSWSTLAMLPIIALQAVLLVPACACWKRRTGRRQLSSTTWDEDENSPLVKKDSARYSPPGKEDVAAATGSSLREIVADPNFWILSIVIMFGTGASLTFINNLAQHIKSLASSPGNPVPSDIANVHVVTLSVANCYGRIFWGYCSDTFPSVSRCGWLTIVSGSTAGAMLAASLAGNVSLMYMVTSWSGFSYGGYWALLPGILADFYGTKWFAATYSLVSLAPALGGYLFSVELAGSLYDYHKDDNQPECYGIECYELTYQILCVACCLGTFGGMLLSWRTRALTAKSDTGSSNTDQ